MQYPEIYNFKATAWDETMHELGRVGKYVDLYEKGVITQYELFRVTREKKCTLPESFLSDYNKWCEEHPEGPDLLTFSIIA